MKPNPNETKNEFFCRVISARVNKILNMMDLIKKGAKAPYYEYTQEQVEQIFSTLQEKLQEVKLHYDVNAPQKAKHFKLEAVSEVPEKQPASQQNAGDIKLYRLAISRNGYVTIPAGSESEALEKILEMSETDFDWEDINKDVLEDSSVVETFDVEEDG